MILSEIEKEIVNLNGEIKNLGTLLRKASQRASELRDLRESMLMERFVDYIELDSTFTFQSFMSFNGIQTGIKPTDTHFSPNFTAGDVIKFIKKNKKSIVIICTTKTISQRENGVVVKKVDNSYNKTFRVEISSLYHNLLRNETFKRGFETYIKRKEALDLIGI
jgi:hypothetical protein